MMLLITTSTPYILSCRTLIVVLALITGAPCTGTTSGVDIKRPLLIASSKFNVHHSSNTYHPECPARTLSINDMVESLNSKNIIKSALPSAEIDVNRYVEAENVINMVHKEDYIKDIKIRCEKGIRVASPWYSTLTILHSCSCVYSTQVSYIR